MAFRQWLSALLMPKPQFGAAAGGSSVRARPRNFIGAALSLFPPKVSTNKIGTAPRIATGSTSSLTMPEARVLPKGVPDNCCMKGCDVCVWDDYCERALKRICADGKTAGGHRSVTLAHRDWPKGVPVAKPVHWSASP